MGYDVSFHPVPLELVQERLIPYLLGEGSLEDLLTTAVRRVRVRARAKAWGQAVQRLDSPPRRFEPSLHLQGRPFFLVVDDKVPLPARPFFDKPIALLGKLDESLALAQRKGWAFAEATEIYSTAQGQLN